ncbi:MAG: hypothetical protein KDI51_11475 [Xanthomonadales bacterium]|nr:hypothetical protein [Xanthomonadales bacterium]
MRSVIAALLWLSMPALACERIEASLRVHMASAGALAHAEILSADPVEAPQQTPGQAPIEVVQHALGLVRERIYGELPELRRLSLRRVLKPDPGFDTCEVQPAPLRPGEWCYAAAGNRDTNGFACLNQLPGTAEQIRHIGRELDARANMSAGDWDDMLAPLIDRLVQVAGTDARHCQALLQIESDRPVKLRQTYAKPFRCLNQGREFIDEPFWFVVENLWSMRPELLAGARAKGGAMATWSVPLDTLANGALSLNPKAIQPIDCVALASRMDGSQQPELCRTP